VRKPINRFLYRFLQKELEDAKDENIISKAQYLSLMDRYEEGKGPNVVWTVATVGAVLVGLGFLLVVANQWEALHDVWKVTIIVLSAGAALSASIFTERVHRYTSRGLRYLAVLIYGSGIFLIVDAFDLNVLTITSLFLWTFGALLLGAVKKDIVLLVFAHVVATIGVINGIEQWIVWQLLFMTALMIAANYWLGYPKKAVYFLIAYLLLVLLYFPIYYELNGLAAVWAFMAIGNAMYYFKQSFHQEAFKTMGLWTVGVSGFALSFAGVWETAFFIESGNVYAVLFTILFAAYLFYLLTHKRIVPLVTIGALILRFYFDELFDFLPRALFFVIGGVLLIGIGFFIERYYNRIQKQK